MVKRNRYEGIVPVTRTVMIPGPGNTGTVEVPVQVWQIQGADALYVSRAQAIEAYKATRRKQTAIDRPLRRVAQDIVSILLRAEATEDIFETCGRAFEEIVRLCGGAQAIDLVAIARERLDGGDDGGDDD